ncbi:unnamed protein product [Ambrosiozyma monospora]|uniref:Unnamed protein product n=1 Tax=Ambrosiozyma monospora TaxID=43982 RepID=A0ACB5TE75_AMBMO|nr:unnamed protein product [Ambrosiozyma monospora]
MCDRIGRKYTMMLGFCGNVIFGLIIGCAYDKVTKIVPLFIVFYGLMNSLSNMGPGDMTIVAASESFPTAVRGTCYGLAAAIGKVGAVVGTECFTPIRDNLGKKWTFIIAAICGIAGILVAWISVPHLKEDDLMENDIKFNKFLAEHGWHGEKGIVSTTVPDEEKQKADK